MKKLVVDSSVAIKWYIPQPYFTESLQILDDYQNNRISLFAPDFIYAELGNIVWKYQRFQGLTDDNAENIVNDFRSLSITTIPARVLLPEAYKIAVQYRRSVYDSLYIALGLQLQCQFVTADEKLVNAVKDSIPNVIFIGNYA